MGIGEQIKGTAKQAVGSVTDNDELQAEGEAQVDKGTEQLKADKADAEAKAHEAKAAAADKEQKAAENAG